MIIDAIIDKVTLDPIVIAVIVRTLIDPLILETIITEGIPGTIVIEEGDGPVDGALDCDRLVLVSAHVDDDPGDLLRIEDPSDFVPSQRVQLESGRKTASKQ
jgi:hypothetical protein